MLLINPETPNLFLDHIQNKIKSQQPKTKNQKHQKVRLKPKQKILPKTKTENETKLNMLSLALKRLMKLSCWFAWLSLTFPNLLC